MTWVGIEEVQARFREVMQRARGPMSEQAVTKVLITAEGFSASMTPVATSNLINSAYRTVWRSAGGWAGQLGYGANYAVYVHSAPGTLLGTQTPRSPSRLGFVWGPNGEPGFLEKGADITVRDHLDIILRASYTL